MAPSGTLSDAERSKGSDFVRGCQVLALAERLHRVTEAANCDTLRGDPHIAHEQLTVVSQF